MKQITLVLADDHPIFLRGLRHTVEEAGLHVVATAGDGREALAAVVTHQPDLVVLDISMPDVNGLTVATNIRAEVPGTAILLLSLYDTPGYVARAKEIPVDGYLLKENASQTVVQAIRQIMGGRPFFGPTIERQYQQVVNPLTNQLLTLTRSERKILRLMTDGLSIREIAATVFLSPRTVEKHRENISRKLEVRQSTGRDLTEWAVHHRILVTVTFDGV